MTSSWLIAGRLVVSVVPPVVATLAMASACGSSEGANANDGVNGTGGDGSGTQIGVTPGPGINAAGGLGKLGSGGNGSGAPECAAQKSSTGLKPVYLAFAFDVSGSMGKLDYPYYDPKLKWEPVVAATKSFFGDPASAGISATLTFFPAAAAICSTTSYARPDVPLTGLPSPVFAAALDAITPTSPSGWRGGTPTLAIVQASTQVLQGMPADGTRALVLVTDGYPQGCTDNSIDSVVSAVTSSAALGLPTYVIGILNPPSGPDTVSQLDALAKAGTPGGSAFIVQTGSPEATKAQFAGVIDGIRKRSVSCEVAIPPVPAGQTFDKSKVNVTYTSGLSSTAFGVDATCTAAGAWHYDDPMTPKSIVLCPTTCATVQGDPKAALSVEFGCAQRVATIR